MTKRVDDVGSLRIFVGLRDISGYFSRLKLGFTSLGYRCFFVDLDNHRFNYGPSDFPWLCKQIRFFHHKRGITSFGFIGRTTWFLLENAATFVLFAQVTLTCHVFIFAFGDTFFSLRELWVLRLLRKTIVFVFAGSDIRPPYLNGVAVIENANSCKELADHTVKMANRCKKMERFADVIISYPTYSHFLRRKAALVTTVGFPIPAPPLRQPFPNGDKTSDGDETVSILHAPSRPVTKGSEIIRKAISELIAKGYKINYTELSDQPNETVISEIQKCDFVVDQVFSDAPMSGLAVEAATAGKPVIIGSYAAEIFEQFHNTIGSRSIPRFHVCYPENLKDAIEQMMTVSAQREEHGKQLKQFVRDRWTSSAVAARFLRLINRQAPSDWFFSPLEIQYYSGYGMPKETVRRVARDLLRYGGTSAFQLSHNPQLEEVLTSSFHSANPKNFRS